MKQILNSISNLDNCKIAPKKLNLERIPINIPTDLKEFYQYCNGVELFIDSEYPYRILGIEEIIRTDLSVLGELIECGDSISWYNIAEDYNGDFLSIDLSCEKFGWCYDSFYETYGLINDMPIIAKSFKELLFRLYSNKGNYPYWKLNEFDKIYGFYE